MDGKNDAPLTWEEVEELGLEQATDDLGPADDEEEVGHGE